jgi:hypothetical protein
MMQEPVSVRKVKKHWTIPKISGYFEVLLKAPNWHLGALKRTSKIGPPQKQMVQWHFNVQSTNNSSSAD